MLMIFFAKKWRMDIAVRRIIPVSYQAFNGSMKKDVHVNQTFLGGKIVEIVGLHRS